MATNLSGSEPLDASEMGRREFTKIRKGWDPVEVRAHLLRMADEITRLQEAERELRSQVQRLEAAAADPEELDESKLTRLLGEETARVLEAARNAAGDIRAKAEDSAARLVREAQDEATRQTRDAEELRQSVAREADELVGAARVRADELVAEARETAKELREDAEAEATSTRERAERVAAELRSESEADAERARTAANELRAEAEEHSTRVRREADDAAAATRAAADNAAAEVRGEADAAAERVRADAVEGARERGEEAARAAEAEVERAREQGRTMVHEAREARERMLRDLAERRKVARQQLEALRAGRERLLDAFQSVRGAFDDATDQLVESLPAARSAADDAARAVDDDIDAAVAELDLEIGGGFDTAVAISDTADASNGGVDDSSDASEDEADAEVVAGSSRLRLVPGSGSDLDDDFDDELSDDAVDADEADDADESGEGESSSGGSVDALFARLRADQDAEGEADGADEDDDAEAFDDLDEIADGEDDDELADDDDATDASDHGVVLAFESERNVIAEVVELPRETPPSSVTALLDRRDDRLANAERNVTRRLKRALSDQENSVLHSVRGDRKARTVDSVLGAAGPRAAELADVVVAELVSAVDAGAGLFDDDDHSVAVDAEAVAGELAPLVDEWLAAPLRDRLERTVADTDLAGDRDELVERVRSLYRELRQDRLDELVGDLITAACNQGVLASSRGGVAHLWLVDHGGLPCPDGEDNHLAGAVIAGEPFPTGDLRPPAQPGCRCLLMPAPR